MKGYHPGVSGTTIHLNADDAHLLHCWLEEVSPARNSDSALACAIDNLRSMLDGAAPSHPPATPAQVPSAKWSRLYTTANAPAVAVQAEPVINGKPATARSILDALIDIHDDGQNNPEEHRCYVPEAWRDILAEARAYLAAHPKPAAPATADDAVSDEMLDEITQSVFSHCDSNGYVIEPDTVYDLVKFTMDALRSGASAQPAGGALAKIRAIAEKYQHSNMTTDSFLENVFDVLDEEQPHDR